MTQMVVVDDDMDIINLNAIGALYGQLFPKQLNATPIVFSALYGNVTCAPEHVSAPNGPLHSNRPAPNPNIKCTLPLQLRLPSQTTVISVPLSPSNVTAPSHEPLPKQFTVNAPPTGPIICAAPEHAAGDLQLTVQS